ncbi:ATP-binding protein [Gordonia sp. TBRC 11910]|uniref:ATP-binding protein n=1 Tax=Gordonia asplenii TaxID=2725283 RepID=A0A848L147_9ACTN|nr:ATP-binding protein [Gordonia asplenii]NMO04604.1 ATP-binding protein [Gordonia asplenii]
MREPLWLIAVALLLILAVALMFSAIARWLLRGRARLQMSTSIVLSIFGSSLGLLLANAIKPVAHLRDPLSILSCLVLSVAVIAAYGGVVAHFQRPQLELLSDLIAAGESDRVEFKSTARVNLRSGDKDPRMEQVIVKTVAAFLNADGGTLLIGVDDDGSPLGLDADYATLKVPDADRFELWLRDLLTTSLGQTTAAEVSIGVEPIGVDDGQRPVCRVRVSASPRPVYLSPGKNAPREFWVRSGNSTRQLHVDSAAEYVMHRWPLRVGSSVAAQFKAAVRFSAER